jgi:superfamily II DNA or RNA helicase
MDMDNETILKLTRALANRGEDDKAGYGATEENDIGPNKPDYPSLYRISFLPYITTQQAILTAKRLVKYSGAQLPDIAKELGIEFDAEALIVFSRQPVADIPIISVMRYEDRYGPRIALHMPYNQDAQDALKHALPFPRCKFEGSMKVWSIMDDEEVIRTAVEILCHHNFDFSPWLLTEEGYGSQGLPSPKSPSSTTKPRLKSKNTNATASLDRDNLVLNWPFIPDPELRDGVRLKVKSIPGRKFNMDEKYWTIPVSHGHTLFKELDGYYQPLADAIKGVPEVEEYLEGALKRVALSQAFDLDDEELKASIAERLSKIFPEGKGLYPFQYAGVAFAELAGGRCLIGDDMGIGKTIQALAYAVLHPEHWPVVVICPANVKFNWAKEIEAWVPNATCSVVKNGKDPIQDTDFIVINYDLMHKRVDDLQIAGVKMCIIDESHYLKNSKTKRTQATFHLANTCESILCLSGTAISNRPIEFYTTLNLLRPAQFSNFFQFAQRYTNAYHNGYGWDFSGTSNSLELNERIRDFTIRRLKTEVLKELPEKTRSFIPVQMIKSERKEYIQSRLDWMRQYERYQNDGGMPAGFVLNMLTDLRHVCGRMKVSACIEWVTEYHDQTGKPVVVYAHHRDVSRAITEALLEGGFRVATITGETPSHKRAENVEEFQRGGLDVLVCATLAAKEGITLTAADTVIFVEREWVPGWEVQAEDRVLRIGQEADSVHAIYLSCAGTIDEHFDRVIEVKREVVTAVLDGGDEVKRAGIVSALLTKMHEHEGFPLTEVDA